MNGKFFKIMFACCALSLLSFALFNGETAKTAVNPTKKNASAASAVEFSMTVEQAAEIMLESGFMPMLPPTRPPLGYLKVQKSKNSPYEKISVLAAKKPIIAHFWATWCGPCKRELPEFARFAQKIADRIDVYAIATELKNGDAGAARAIWNFYESGGIKGLNATCDENGALASTLGVTGIPVTFLIDGNGQVIGQFLGATDWSSEKLASAILTVLK